MPAYGKSVTQSLVAASGDVDVTDMMGDAIYRISGGSAEVWLEDVPRPNGILADGERPVFVFRPVAPL